MSLDEHRKEGGRDTSLPSHRLLGFLGNPVSIKDSVELPCMVSDAK